MLKTCLPGSEKSESSSAKFAAPSPLPEPMAIMKTGTNVKTNTCTETFPNIFSNKSHKKLDKILRLSEKESLKNHFLLKSYKGFCPGTHL